MLRGFAYFFVAVNAPPLLAVPLMVLPETVPVNFTPPAENDEQRKFYENMAAQFRFKPRNYS